MIYIWKETRTLMDPIFYVNLNTSLSKLHYLLYNNNQLGNGYGKWYH